MLRARASSAAHHYHHYLIPKLTHSLNISLSNYLMNSFSQYLISPDLIIFSLASHPSYLIIISIQNRTTQAGFTHIRQRHGKDVELLVVVAVVQCGDLVQRAAQRVDIRVLTRRFATLSLL